MQQLYLNTVRATHKVLPLFAALPLGLPVEPPEKTADKRRSFVGVLGLSVGVFLGSALVKTKRLRASGATKGHGSRRRSLDSEVRWVQPEHVLTY